MPRGPTIKPQPTKVVVPQRGEPWELPALDHEKRDETVLSIAQAVYDAGLQCIDNDAWSSAYCWWSNVFGDRDNPGGQDPYRLALYAFGATKEMCDDTSTPFGLMFARMMVALEIKHGRRVAKIEDSLYRGALEPQATAAQKLYLQAHKPEKYVPVTKSRVTVGDIEDAMREASNDVVIRHSEIDNP